MKIMFILPHEMPLPNKDEVIEDIENLRLPPLVIKGLVAIKEKIKQRFKVFEDEILKEESQQEEAMILIDLRTGQVGQKYVAYSAALSAKMDNSLTKNDFTLIIREIF